MARKPKPVDGLDKACSALLRERAKKKGLSQQRLATATGISQNRVGIILRGERAASVGEIAKLAECVATTASAVITQAEALTSGATPSASAPGSSGSGAEAEVSSSGVGENPRTLHRTKSAHPRAGMSYGTKK